MTATPSQESNPPFLKPGNSDRASFIISVYSKRESPPRGLWADGCSQVPADTKAMSRKAKKKKKKLSSLKKTYLEFKWIQQSMNFDGVHLFVELHEVVTQRFPCLSPHRQLVIQFAVWLSLVAPRAAHCALTFPQPCSQEMRTERGQKRRLSAFGLYRQFPRSDVLWL